MRTRLLRIILILSGFAKRSAWRVCPQRLPRAGKWSDALPGSASDAVRKGTADSCRRGAAVSIHHAGARTGLRQPQRFRSPAPGYRTNAGVSSLQSFQQDKGFATRAVRALIFAGAWRLAAFSLHVTLEEWLGEGAVESPVGRHSSLGTILASSPAESKEQDRLW